MPTLSNSVDPDEIPNDMAFHWGLLCLLRHKRSSEKYNFHLEIITCDLSLYIMDHLKFNVSNHKEDSIGA